MPRYEFDRDDELSEHVPDTESVESIRYSGSKEIVHTTEEDNYSQSQLEEMDRSGLYELGEDLGADMDWSGEDADSREEMVVKVSEAIEEDD